MSYQIECGRPLPHLLMCHHFFRYGNGKGLNTCSREAQLCLCLIGKNRHRRGRENEIISLYKGSSLFKVGEMNQFWSWNNSLFKMVITWKHYPDWALKFIKKNDHKYSYNQILGVKNLIISRCITVLGRKLNFMLLLFSWHKTLFVH